MWVCGAWCVGAVCAAEAWGAVRCAGLAGLGLGACLGGWELGRLCRRPGLGWLWRSQLAALAQDLRVAPPGEARLAALRRLADWLRPSEPWWARALEDLAWTTAFPDGLVPALFHCLMESGPEAAPLICDLLDSPYFDNFWASTHDETLDGRLSDGDREELLTEGFLGRLRAFFLGSGDQGVQKAFLRLISLASDGLAFADRRVTSGMNGGPSAQVAGAQLQRYRDFVTETGFTRKVAEFFDGAYQPDEVFKVACGAYAELESRSVAGAESGATLIFPNLHDFYGACPLILHTMEFLGPAYDHMCWHLDTSRSPEGLSLAQTRRLGEALSRPTLATRESSLHFFTAQLDDNRWEKKWSEVLVRSGGWAVLERHLRLHQPPFDEDDAYGRALATALFSARRLLSPQHPDPHGLDVGETTERLLAWFRQGFGPVLQRLLAAQPLPGARDLRPAAQALKDLHDQLLLSHPNPQPTKLPTLTVDFPW